MNDVAPSKAGWSTGKKVGCGCGAVTLLGLGILVAILVFAVLPIWNWISDLEAQGYQLQTAQSLVVDEPLSGPMIFMGESVTVTGDSGFGIAMLGESLTVEGTITGDIIFWGKSVTIEPDGHVTGDVDFKGESLRVNGKLDGSVTFAGARLIIGANAIVLGDITVIGAQSIEVKGRVDGKISGYDPGALDDQREEVPAGATDGATEDPDS